ncbi:hypothetical protein [Streptomyces zagrosensis]|uniref:Thiamine transporter ThiT n=1 Tax=Streptomyces zagrosensis TaxID=1042984 RepID=A0A7W9UW18_9ACTN|nr:hypothetical protein [Streptomyces zagrosensis]MBB5933062.1 thiamine transporter ThiT [Streptomyces zagrosensis]
MTGSMKTALLVMGVVVAVLLSLLVAVVAGVLAYADNATVPAATARAGVAFGGTMGLLTGLLALLAGAFGG